MVDNSSGASGEVELNLAPIIDCFTVLITYLLVTASFLTLTALDVSVSANSDKEAPPPPLTDEKPMVMTMDLASTGEVILKISGGDLKKDYDLKLPAKADGSWDSEQLNVTLEKVKNRWDKLKEISVSAASTVKYKELVHLINETQKSLPKVYISGG
jgi:biopolymer transport protein ExbD